METNNPPMSAMAYTASNSPGKKVKQTAANPKTVEVIAEPVESTSDMFIRPFEELSNPEGYLYFSPF